MFVFKDFFSITSINNYFYFYKVKQTPKIIILDENELEDVTSPKIMAEKATQTTEIKDAKRGTISNSKPNTLYKSPYNT
jgi:hypothetical protein